MLDVPRECIEHYLAVPDADTVERWWQALVRLWDDDEAYREAVARAREAGSAFHPAATAPRAVSYFDALLAARS
jgi:hypothetical protein